MGQIVFNNQKPKYCKLQAIRPGGLHVNDNVALNEVWLVDTTEAAKSATGTGEYDAYIIGDGSHKAGQLELHYLGTAIDISRYSTTLEMQSAINQAITNANIPRNLSQLNEDTNHRTVTDAEKDLWSAGGSGGITNNVDHEDLTSVEVSQGVNVIKFNDKDYNASTYSGLGKKYLRKNVQLVDNKLNGEIPPEDLNYKQYIDTYQNIGQVCPMTVGTHEQFTYYKTNVYQGEVWTIIGEGGNTPRLWALVDSTTSKIIAHADVEVNSFEIPVELVIEQDCILIVNSRKTPPVIQYRKILNTQSEKNVITPAMVSSSNTRYIIQYDYDLGGNTLTFPENSVLVFQGGSITNGMLIGNGTSIEAGENEKIFDLTTYFGGTWHTQDFYPEWFGAKGDMVNDDTDYINKVLNLNMTKTTSRQIGITCHLNNRYRVTDTLFIKDDCHISGKSNVSFGKGSNTNSTILADFGEDWKKWVISTYNRAKNSANILPFNAPHSSKVGYTFMGGGIKVEGINIQTVTPVYGGLRICGATDSSIENVSIRGVYVGIMRGGNWYSADCKINISAKMCGYACASENNGHSLRDAYINAAAVNMSDEGVNWIEYTITEDTTILDKNGNEVILNIGDIVQIGITNTIYKDNTWYEIANNEQFNASFVDGENTVNVTYLVESGVGIPWFDLGKRYMAPKWQFDEDILMSHMPTYGIDNSVKYIYAKKSIGYLQAYGNSILSNVVMEIWTTGVFVTSGSLIDENAYRESIDGCLYLTYYASLDVQGFVNGDYTNIDGIKRYHYINAEGSFDIIRSNPHFRKIAVLSANPGKVTFENCKSSETPPFKAYIVRDRKESAYTVTVADTTTTAFSKNIEDALKSEFEHINIPANKTINYAGTSAVRIGTKRITGSDVNTSVLNFNTSMAFVGRKLTFERLTININAPIKLDEYYNDTYYNRQIEFIGCKIIVNGTTIISGDSYYDVSLIITGMSFYKGSLVLKDAANTRSYIAATPGASALNIDNLSLYIHPNSNIISTSVVDANGDAVPNTTVYDRIFSSNIRGTNLHLPGLLTYGSTANRPALTPNMGIFMYFDSTLGQPVWWTGSNWTTWESGGTSIVSYNTAPSTIIAEDNKYYKIDDAAFVTSLAITLPAITDTISTHGIMFYFTTGENASVTFSSANNTTISYYEGYEIKDYTTYEINAVYNGSKWIIAYGVVA